MKFLLKNNSDSTFSYLSGTVVLGPQAELEVASRYWFPLMMDSAFSIDLRYDNFLVRNGVDVLSYPESREYLERVLLIVGNKDSDGSSLSRGKITTTGWKAQFHAIRISTSTVDGIRNKNRSGNDLGLTTYKMLDDEGAETQEPSECVKTRVTWEPNHDMEIVGGELLQAGPPSTDIYMYTTVAAHIPVQYGGSVEFLEGGLNLADVGIGGDVDFDGKAPKWIAYDNVYHSGRFTIEFQHNAGVQHSFTLVFKIYRP